MTSSRPPSARYLPLRTAYTASKGLPGPERRPRLRPSARVPSRAGTRSRASPRPRKRQASSAKQGSKPAPYRASLPARRSPSLPANISTCSMSRVLPAPGRCGPSLKRSSPRTVFWSSETPASIRAWTPAGLSSRCRKPGCRPQSWTPSCVRKTRSCFARCSTLP